MVKLIETFMYVMYPLLSAISWAIVIWQNIRYKKRIAELERFKRAVIAALNLPYNENA